MNKVSKQQEIQSIEKEETVLEGCMTEIIKMMLEKQKDIQEEEEEKSGKRLRRD